MKRFFILSISYALMMLANVCIAKSPEIAPSYAWKMLPPLGLHEPATIDTLLYNYYIQAVPNDVSLAWATTGNLGAQGMNMIYFDRPAMSDFFFHDALAHWLPEKGNHKYYNTRVPMTLLSYNFGGGTYIQRAAITIRQTKIFHGDYLRHIWVTGMSCRCFSITTIC